MEYEDGIRKLVNLGVGLASMSKEKLTDSARQLADTSKLSPAQTRELIKELVERGEQRRLEIQKLVQEQVQKSVHKLGFDEKGEALRSEVIALRHTVTHLDKRVTALESRLREGRSDTSLSDED